MERAQQAAADSEAEVARLLAAGESVNRPAAGEAAGHQGGTTSSAPNTGVVRPWCADFTSESSSRNFRVAPPPKFPTTYSTSAYINWARRVKNYLITADISHAIEPNAPAIPVISRGDDEYLAHQYGAAVVRDHR
ncbi:unnamed protein product, partial [Pylaiella littoralis]